ncbi:MAG: T9SS type A sorting domain-containing protein [Bacteroidetes bacterium]|nr:T9SS type A sorting domain-containing protein [Bacteroidota bacterium]
MIKYKIIGFILLSIGYYSAKTQCIVDAGPDTTFCEQYPIETLTLGSNVTVTGEAPFSYSWSCYYEFLGHIYTASDFINDTTVINPSLISGIDGEQLFTLTVTDATGATCSDDIIISLYPFVNTLEVKQAYISSMDTTSLYSALLGGTFPYTYLWSPDYVLSDPTDLNTLASPDVTTVYSLLLTDANGCQAHDLFYVFVYPVGISELEKDEHTITIVPNPVKNTAQITVGNEKNFTLNIYDVSGRLIKFLHSTNPTIEINNSMFSSGIYSVQYVSENKNVITTKMVIL